MKSDTKLKTAVLYKPRWMFFLGEKEALRKMKSKISEVGWRSRYGKQPGQAVARGQELMTGNGIVALYPHENARKGSTRRELCRASLRKIGICRSMLLV